MSSMTSVLGPTPRLISSSFELAPPPPGADAPDAIPQQATVLVSLSTQQTEQWPFGADGQLAYISTQGAPSKTTLSLTLGELRSLLRTMKAAARAVQDMTHTSTEATA